MITLRDVTLRRGARVLLENASVTINPGERVGLVGKNGAGKSTLFALLAGELHEDGGDCTMPPHWRIAQVAQQMPETDQSATAFVLAGDTRLVRLQAQLAEAEARGDGIAIAQAHADLADAGAHDAAARAQALILGLGFQSSDLERPVNDFSGGWRMRLALARALMSPSELLLLDEPTNHLDLDALVWLEGWLKRYDGTLIVISHDREFLDAVTGVTLQIEHGRLTRYGGNYSQFEELRAQQLVLQQAAYQRQQQRIAHLQHFIDRFKAKATKARQAQSRVKALERMEKIAPVLASADFTFEFREPASLPNPMLAIRDAAFGYRADAAADADPESDGDGNGNGAHDADTVVLQGVKLSVRAGQRIGILGANGQGKSTLVKTIAHELRPLAGKLTEGKGLAIGYFAQQELDVLRAGDTPLEHMTRLARDTAAASATAGMATREQDLRNFLGSFNFGGDMIAQPVGTMSGGEKARLVLAMIVWQRPNLLLLDEPTNHLDLATREALAVALNEFEGTVMLVSHDRALLRAVCDEFWLVARGRVAPFDGDLDDYQRFLLDDAKRRRESMQNGPQTKAGSSQSATDSIANRTHPQPAPSAPEPRNAAEQRRMQAQRRQQRSDQTRPLKTELAACEQRMAELGTETAKLEALLATNPAPAQIADTGRRLKAAGDELQALEDQWLELSQQIERIEQQFET